MSADNTHLAGGMERGETCFSTSTTTTFCYYYCGRIAKMCVRGACMSLPLLLGTVLR